MHFWMLKIVILWLEGSKFQKKCFDRIGTGSYSIEATEKKLLTKKMTQKRRKCDPDVYFS